jgi:hypothetical protein
MRVSRTYGGNHYKAEDLDKPILLTIDQVTSKEFDDGKEKLVLAFGEDEHTFVCNLTNAQTLAELYGDETDDWIGEKVVLYATRTLFQGKQTPCIRVRAPKPAAPVGAGAKIGPPYGPVRRRNEPVTQPEADEPVDVQTNDDIPF